MAALWAGGDGWAGVRENQPVRCLRTRPLQGRSGGLGAAARSSADAEHRPPARPEGYRAVAVTRSLSTRRATASSPASDRFTHSTTDPPLASGAYSPALSPSHVS